jgi:hypothetical protein
MDGTQFGGAGELDHAHLFSLDILRGERWTPLFGYTTLARKNKNLVHLVFLPSLIWG